MRLFLLCSLVVCFFGCAKPNTISASKNNSNKTIALQNAEKFMRLSQGDTQESATYKLQAIEQLIAADDIEQAEYTINENFTNIKLDANNGAHKQIVLAQIDLAKRNLPEAKQHLRNIWTPAKLPEDLLVKFYQTRAEVYRRSGNLLDAVQERIYLAKHLHNLEEQTQNNLAIWESLAQLTPTALKTMPRDSTKTVLNGWLEFAAITKQYNASSEQMLAALNQWQVRFPKHPALGFMPNELHVQTAEVVLENNENVPVNSTHVISTPKRIALMLPLQGTHAKSAQAVRDGFLSAFYAQADGPNKPTIQIYDTTAQNMQQLYRHIVDQGADFIVGPLTKEEVDAISSSTRAEVPMLALNNSNRTTAQDNILQFGLSPELEAQSVARKAWNDGHRTAAVIIPKSAWGKRMLQAFERTWVEQGGTIISTAEIGSQSGLTNGVKRLLAIDASEARAQKIKQSGIKINFDPRRRQDIDMIFIATNAALARQVKPLLNFYYAGNIPAYASSSIYSGKAQPSLDQDLNGIQFCDMPWLLDHSIDTHGAHKQVEELWQNDFDQYARLYALGLDAYKIAQQIEQLTMMPTLGISGMTGMLTLDKQQSIERKLMWASFKKGLPQVSGDQD